MKRKSLDFLFACCLFVFFLFGCSKEQAAEGSGAEKKEPAKESVGLAAGGGKEQCLKQLKAIDDAKQQFVGISKKGKGDRVFGINIVSHLKHGTLPKCPDGGEYIINPVGTYPQCSIHTTPPEDAQNPTEEDGSRNSGNGICKLLKALGFNGTDNPESHMEMQHILLSNQGDGISTTVPVVEYTCTDKKTGAELKLKQSFRPVFGQYGQVIGSFLDDDKWRIVPGNKKADQDSILVIAAKISRDIHKACSKATEDTKNTKTEITVGVEAYRVISEDGKIVSLERYK